MGLFDYINFKTECPKCKNKLNEFQSKNGPCAMYTLEFWMVDNFYDMCHKCETYVEYTIKKRENRTITIKDYTKKITTYEEEEDGKNK